MAMPAGGSPAGRFGGYDQGPPMMSQGGGYGPPQGYGPTSTQQGGGNFAPFGAGGGNPGYNYGPPGQAAPAYTNPGGYGPPGGYDNSANVGMKAIGMSAGHMNDVFFAAACCIVLGSSIGGICLFFTLEPVDFIQMTYLMIFGGVLAVLDTPFLKTISMVVDAKMYIGKYVQFVTRVTGKGITLVFLGTSLFMTMWDNLSGGFMEFLAVVLCLFPTAVGLCSVAIGILKSTKLDKAKRQLQLVIDQRYDHFAQTYRGPNGGLTMSEFNMLTMENGGFKFESMDLQLIFQALLSNPTWRMAAAGNQSGQYQQLNNEIKISKADLMDWCKGGMVFL